MSEHEASSRKRAPNYTVPERERLLNIVERYKSIIENKKTDGVSVKDKKDCWQKVSEEFNAASPSYFYRSIDSLKKFYEKQKEELRKRYALEKKELYKTGGGPEIKNVLQDDLLMAIVNEKSVKGLDNPFDSDSLSQRKVCGKFCSVNKFIIYL